MKTGWLCGLAVSALSGCTGMSLGENAPGADTYMGRGAIAVDDRSEQSFVVEGTQTFAQRTSTSTEQTLFAIDPDDGSVRTVQDLTGRKDMRLLFPSSGILVMSEVDGLDVLELRDAATFAPKATKHASVRYHGTRMSPSRNWVAVADNTSDTAPIHIVDATTLETRVIPHDGDWLEAMWMHQQDELVAIVFYDVGSTTASARIMSWSIETARQSGFVADSTGFWPNPKMDIRLPGTTADMFFSFTWVGVSPDDHYVVFPVRKTSTGGSSYALVVLDTTNQTLRTVDGAKGPVGFTPDGSTIVSYSGSVDQRLLLIDTATLAVDPEDVPIDGGITYFVSREGNQVVVAGNFGDQRLTLYDIDNQRQTQMAGPAIGLDEFVSRIGHDELWLVDQQALFRLDMRQGLFETVSTSFAPQHVNILPTRDRLVLDGAGTNKLFFMDPSTKRVTRTVSVQ